MTILFDRLAYMDHLKRVGLSEEHARAHTEALEAALHSAATAYTEALEEALHSAAATNINLLDILTRIESRLDQQERDKKAFWNSIHIAHAPRTPRRPRPTHLRKVRARRYASRTFKD